jgi:predicted RNA-binding protein with RPS1 domain
MPLVVGQLVEGTVKALQPYGAFVTLKPSNPKKHKSAAGLLHVSQLSSVRVEDVAAVLSVGMKLRCAALALVRCAAGRCRGGHVRCAAVVPVCCCCCV